jgi:hypothetical protein
MLRGERSDSDVTGNGLARRQSDTLASLQITNGERMIFLDLALAGDSYWQSDECSHKLSIDFLCPLRRCHTGSVEEQRPVDGAFTWYCAKAQEIRKERHGISL